jgi:hypothetical protein
MAIGRQAHDASTRASQACAADREGPMKLIIEVAFARKPTPNGELDIRRAVQNLREDLEYLGEVKVTRADLVKVDV